MRKRLVPRAPDDTFSTSPPQWIDLATAVVEITSEDPEYPIERALLADDSTGWRAASPGIQTIRLVFDEPRDLQHVSLAFSETIYARTQEFALRWLPQSGGGMQEIVRQQWNFSPAGGANEEAEEYDVQLPGAQVLELTINPDIANGESFASLKRLRIA